MKSKTSSTDLEQLRQKIDQIDRELVELLKERWKWAQKIRAYKIREGLSLKDLQREREILKKITKTVEAASLRKLLRKVYNILFISSRGSEKSE